MSHYQANYFAGRLVAYAGVLRGDHHATTSLWNDRQTPELWNGALIMV